MIKTVAIAALAAACLLLLGLNLMTSDFLIDRNHETRCRYENIAFAEVRKHYPDFDAYQPMAVRQAFGHIVVYYPVPYGAMGGSPEVEVQRITCKVLRVYRTQ